MKLCRSKATFMTLTRKLGESTSRKSSVKAAQQAVVATQWMDNRTTVRLNAFSPVNAAWLSAAAFSVAVICFRVSLLCWHKHVSTTQAFQARDCSHTLSGHVFARNVMKCNRKKLKLLQGDFLVINPGRSFSFVLLTFFQMFTQLISSKNTAYLCVIEENLKGQMCVRHFFAFPHKRSEDRFFRTIRKSVETLSPQS